MVKERLSQLQKATLTYLYKEGAKGYGNSYKYGGLRYVMAEGNDRNSFRSKFSQSIRNLEKKQLIDVIYCHQIQKREYRQIKKCEGRKPEYGNPCEDCFYVKKYDHRLSHFGFRIEFIAGDDYCGFFFIKGYCGRDVPKKRIKEIKLTGKGRDTILKAVVTPEMRRDAEKDAKWRISQLKDFACPDIEIPDYEDEVDKRLKKKAKEILLAK